MARTGEARFGPHDTCVGIDVGKSSRWAYAVDADGNEVPGRRLANGAEDVDALLGEAGAGALVVVDQRNDIGSLVVRRCRAKGADVGHVTGPATRKARDMWPGTAKTDRTGAEVIARTTMGMGQVVPPVAESDDLGASPSLVSSQPGYATRCAAQARNRLHAVPLESDPAFEAAVDPSCPWRLAVPSRLGGAAGVSAAGKGSCSATCGDAGAKASSRDALWEAAESSARDGFHPAAEDALAGGLASQIESPGAQRRELEASIARELAGDETYSCLPTIPGVGPKTATTPVAMADVSLFAGDDRLASHCGLAPADRQPGTPVSSTSASRSGNKTLKNLLILSRDSLVGTRNRFGRYYDERGARGMAHNKALKAVARKRLGVIYAVMRDKVPYAEPDADCSKPAAQGGGTSQECSKSAS